MKNTVVVGNPKPNSRTLDAARRVAASISDASVDTVVDVIILGPGLLGWGDDDVAAAVDAVRGSDLVVVASPIFKATYTGVLKLFLDQFATGDGLRGVVAVPVMLGAGPAHALAPELLLKPVLVELGAVTSAPGLYLLDSSYATYDRIADYAQRWGSTIRSAVTQAGPVLESPRSQPCRRPRYDATTLDCPSCLPNASPTRSSLPTGAQRQWESGDERDRAAHQLGFRVQQEAGADRRAQRLRVRAQPGSLHGLLRRRVPARVDLLQPRVVGGNRETEGDRRGPPWPVASGRAGQVRGDRRSPVRRAVRDQCGVRVVQGRVHRAR